MLVVGLTGGIGSGKSAVAELFRALGVPVIDADEAARAVVAPGTPGLERIRARFGDRVISRDGRLDRRRLRDIVFRDPAARRELEGILHPLIRRHMRDRLAALDTPYAILAIPLLLETGQTGDVDRVLVVDCPEQLQIERVRSRDGIDAAQAHAILDAQAGREQRLQAADDIIDNSGPRERLAPQVEALHRKYLALSHATP